MKKATAIAYVRVSTQEQALEGISLEAQEARVRAYCEMRGLELLQVIVDAGVSASKPLAERQGGARLLTALRRRKAPVRHVITVKLDRLFRNTEDALRVIKDWDKTSVALHLLDLGGQAVDTSNGMGRFFLTMLAGIATLERDQIGERTSAALAHRKAQGKRVSRWAPYGTRIEGDDVVVDPIEQRTVRRIMRLHNKGMSVRKIADELNSKSVPARGARWHPTTVQRVLRSQFNAVLETKATVT